MAVAKSLEVPTGIMRRLRASRGCPTQSKTLIRPGHPAPAGDKSGPERSWLDSFDCADSWDEAERRYKGLQASRIMAASADGSGLLIKAGVAARQFEAERAPAYSGSAQPTASQGTATQGPGSKGPAPGAQPPANQPKPTRVHAIVQLNSSPVGRDAGRIAIQVAQPLALLPNTKVTVGMEIDAELPEGAPDPTVRTITENRRTLTFKSQGFERDWPAQLIDR